MLVGTTLQVTTFVFSVRGFGTQKRRKLRLITHATHRSHYIPIYSIKLFWKQKKTKGMNFHNTLKQDSREGEKPDILVEDDLFHETPMPRNTNQSKLIKAATQPSRISSWSQASHAAVVSVSFASSRMCGIRDVCGDAKPVSGKVEVEERKHSKGIQKLFILL